MTTRRQFIERSATAVAAAAVTGFADEAPTSNGWYDRPMRWADPELWVTCGLGPYNFDFMTDVTREIVRLYRVDGIFSNRWEGSGMCYCEHCRENFKKYSGLDLPRTVNPQNPGRRQYIVW